MKKLSEGGKVQARLEAMAIEARALLPVGDERGYPSDEVRAYKREVAAFLRSAGQPHPGTHDTGRAEHCITVMKCTGITARKAARWVLAYNQWEKDFAQAIALKADDLVAMLVAELNEGLKRRAAEIPTKDAQRLHAQVTKVLARGPAGLKFGVALRR